MELPPLESESAPTDSRLAAMCADAAYRAARSYQASFHAITRRAAVRFIARDWEGAQADAIERLQLYAAVLDPLVAEIGRLMGGRLQDTAVWAAIKAVYSSLIARCQEWEIGESFFNSLTRRVFSTVGVDSRVEFLDTDFDAPPTAPRESILRRLEGGALPALIIAALTEAELAAGRFPLLGDEAGEAASRINARLAPDGAVALEVMQSAFFRGKGAFVVGRAITADGAALPVAFGLRHRDDGIRLGALLLGETALAILFSFTRSHFHVHTPRPYEYVRFLCDLMPRKRTSELYTTLGYHKHGKTEFYRDFVQHLRRSTDRFVPAAGTRGMVMIVFTLPTYDVVFKLIRDQFDYPKDSTRHDVMAKYRLVFEHDRAGRLVDAHEFEQVRIEKGRFDPALLEELRRHATQSVRVGEEHVIIQHAYVERRVRPLNLFLAEADRETARAAVVDYGRAILELAAMNIFTGDLLPKNFGVTRSGRVVFYDYDELCWITDCNFRDLPEPQTHEQEMAAEPWYTVRDNDIFPEEFPHFLGLPDELLGALTRAHPGLFQADYWRGVQAAIRAGEIIEILPYGDEARI